MAVNHADGLTFAGAMVCPILSGMTIAGAGAGWLTVPCVVATLPVCLAVLYVGRKLTYLAAGAGIRLAQPIKHWSREILAAPFLLLYFGLPMLGVVAAVLAMSYAALRLVALADHVGGWMGGAAVVMAAVISAVGVVGCLKWYFRASPERPP